MHEPGHEEEIEKSLGWTNLVALTANLNRDNSKFRGYDTNPELFDEMGEAGIKVRSIPWMPKGKPAMTVGNTIYMGPEVGKGGYVGATHPDAYTNMAEEEIPHVAQYRERGLAGFFGKYLLDAVKPGNMYDDSTTLEGFHQNVPKWRYSGEGSDELEKSKLLTTENGKIVEDEASRLRRTAMGDKSKSGWLDQDEEDEDFIYKTLK